jgi:hypothetical protein
MRGIAATGCCAMCGAQDFVNFRLVRPAHVASDSQRLDDMHHVFVVHLDIAGRGKHLLQHGRAGAAARNDEEWPGG